MAIRTNVVPFLFYANQGICKSNREMPDATEQFAGWFTASHVIRNQEMHSKRDIEACLDALRYFLSRLADSQEINQKDLLEYV